MKNKRNHLKLAMRLLILLTAGIIVFLMSVPIELTSYTDKIKSTVAERINGTIEMERIRLRVLPLPTLILDEITLRDSDGEVVVNAQTLKAGFSLSGFLFDRPTLKKLTIIGGSVLMRRAKDGSINLAKIPKKRLIQISLVKLKLKDGTLSFVDEVPEDGAEYRFDDLLAYLNYSGGGFTYSGKARYGTMTDLQFSGEAKETNDDFDISGTVALNELELSALSPYLRKEDFMDMEVGGRVSTDLVYSYIGRGLPDGSGVLKGSITTKDFDIKMPEVFESPIHSNRATSAIDLTWNEDEVLFSLYDTKIGIEDFDILGSLRLSVPTNKKTDQGTPDATETDDTDALSNIEEIAKKRALKLNLSSTPIDVTYLKKYFPYGITPEGVDDIIEGLDTLEGHLQLDGLRFSNNGQTMGKATDYLDAIEANITLNDLGFEHSRFLRRVEDISAKLSIKNSTLAITKAHGTYGEGILDELSVEIRELTRLPKVDVTLTARLDAKEVVDEFKDFYRNKGLIDGLEAGGTALLKLSSSGNLPGWRLPEGTSKVEVKKYNARGIDLNYSLDLTGAEVKYKRFVKKALNHDLKITSTAHADEEEIIIKDTTISSGDSSISATTRISMTTPAYAVALRSDDLYIKDLLQLSPYFEETQFAAGTVAVDITKKVSAKSGTKDETVSAYGGELSINDALFKTPLLARTVRDMNLKVKLNGNKGESLLKSMKVGNSTLSGKIDILDIDKAVVDFNLISERLDTKDIIPKHIGKRKADMGKPFVSGTGKLTVKKGAIHGISFDTFSTNIDLKEDRTIFSPLSFNAHNGFVEGELTYFRDPEESRLFETDFDMMRIELKEFMEDLGVKKEVLSGRFSAEAHLTGERSEGAFITGISGDIKAASKDGRLQKFIVFSKIFSIVNIVSINELFEEGMPYKNISANFKLTNGMLSTENMLFDSKSMRMSAIGYIDIDQGYMNATLGIHPFVTIDKIISNIPIAGWLITGREKSLVTMYYNLEGPFKALSTEPVFIKALGSKVLGIFERLLLMQDKPKGPTPPVPPQPTTSAPTTSAEEGGNTQEARTDG
ncbi:MAG: AsmA-like C-terminal domain-containing protein [Deltaproteobacteria bacterium]|nr:AsmA-like C-terminal domain-containing protein [Deltaproteobacteria bacterium]